MTTPWKAYLQHNRPGGYECQVVTALNAWAFYHGKRYCEQNSHLYTALTRLAKADKGPAGNVAAVYRVLNLDGGEAYSDFSRLPPVLPLPLRFRIFHKRVGYHECLIVDQNRKTNTVRIASFGNLGSTQGWFFREDMYQWARPMWDQAPWFAKHVVRVG